MKDLLFRCSSLGRLMTEPKTKAEGILSVGAKTFVREIAQQDIFGVEFEFGSKETEKGIRKESESIELLNRVRGLALVKNTERRSNGLITGECDLYDAERKRGHDLKTSWSLKTFRAFQEDCFDKLYEWQALGYMELWGADEWEMNWTLLDTPDDLIGYEPLQLHVVSHIPEHLRLTTWVIKRDEAKLARIKEKVLAAREYYSQVVAEFDQTHQLEPA